jgi:hypothetical protein
MSLISKLASQITGGLARLRKDKPVPHKDASPGAFTILENRQLNAEERAFVEWLIANGPPEAKNYAQQLEGLHVVSHCSCGCPRVDFAVVNAHAEQL